MVVSNTGFEITIWQFHTKITHMDNVSIGVRHIKQPVILIYLHRITLKFYIHLSKKLDFAPILLLPTFLQLPVAWWKIIFNKWLHNNVIITYIKVNIPHSNIVYVTQISVLWFFINVSNSIDGHRCVNILKTMMVNKQYNNLRIVKRYTTNIKYIFIRKMLLERVWLWVFECSTIVCIVLHNLSIVEWNMTHQLLNFYTPWKNTTPCKQ